MNYTLDDRRYYPSNASGRWVNEPASPGDMRTARLREFLDQSQGPTEKDRLNEISQLLDQTLASGTGADIPTVDRSLIGFLKEKYGGMSGQDVPELLGWMLQKLHGALGVDATKPPGIEDAMGFAGAVGPLKGAAAAMRGGAKKSFGIKPQKSPSQTNKDIAAEKAAARPLNERDYWDEVDIVNALFPEDVSELGSRIYRGDMSPSPYLDAARAMIKNEPNIGARIASDPALQEAIKKDPSVMWRLAKTSTSENVGTYYENPDWSRNSYARSTGRPDPGKDSWEWRGGYKSDPWDYESRAGWASPVEDVPNTWQSKMASPIDSETAAQALAYLKEAGNSGMKGLRSAGQSLGDLGSEISNKAVAAIPAANRTRIEDLMENYGWLMPVGGVAGAGALLSKLLPPLPSTSTAPSKYDTDPNYVPRDINDPEGIMTSQRRQQMQGDAPWKVFSEMFPWNWR